MMICLLHYCLVGFLEFLHLWQGLISFFLQFIAFIFAIYWYWNWKKRSEYLERSELFELAVRLKFGITEFINSYEQDVKLNKIMDKGSKRSKSEALKIEYKRYSKFHERYDALISNELPIFRSKIEVFQDLYTTKIPFELLKQLDEYAVMCKDYITLYIVPTKKNKEELVTVEKIEELFKKINSEFRIE